MFNIEFEVGKKYENMKGIFEVLAIDGDSMHIRWENGEEMMTTKSFQERVLMRMSMERGRA
ncbi:MAG: hypothetical protein JRH06_16655 [Deltaproteobacteria bacterium]|nr:hypothetical protein [Deltaproteobacteria bacterium]MBW2139168.1 hypothetical protein [Deltaproteobacteria bacterium]